MDASAVHAGNVLELVREHRAPASGPPLTLHPAIAGSWRRCALDYALDPGRRTYSPTVIDAAALAERLVQHADLLQIASAEIDWLYEHIAGSGYALVLTDAEGIVLYEKTDATLVDVFRSAGLMIGADWSERQEGTNGIGTCIAENRPVIVYREEHYRACHIGLSCSGAPIRDPSGSLIAVLDASTLNPRDTRASLAHTMALVSLSAQLIEKCLFLQQFQGETVFRFHARPEFVNLQHSGTMAVSREGRVVAVDDTALWLLRAKSRAHLVGRSVDEIFDINPAELVEPSRRTELSLRPVRDVMSGRHFFISLDQEATRPRTHVVSAPPSREILQLPPPTIRKATLTLEELAGDDPQMLRNVRSARRIANSRVPVMIQGPTGAGKEMFARALHAASDRANRPFVALNCAAIPETLIESELFGYAPGAFTGARKGGMKGKILQSSGGTLFLDEIGDMQLSLQTRLLRVLEEQEVMPLGTDTPIQVDLRVMCASHQNLRAMIARGAFREDLYYRLNGITIELPPLAQRADKERLIREFLSSESCDGRPVAIEMEAFQRLLDYSWPGNVRELRNVIRTILAICDSDVIRLVDLPSEVRLCQSGAKEANATPSSAERDALVQCIRECDGNMSRAAERLGVSRNTLYRRCKRLDIPLQHTRSGLM
jgi:transcriptional regulator of acetoin/glycerol metabolism